MSAAPLSALRLLHEALCVSRQAQFPNLKPGPEPLSDWVGDSFTTPLFLFPAHISANAKDVLSFRRRLAHCPLGRVVHTWRKAIPIRNRPGGPAFESRRSSKR